MKSRIFSRTVANFTVLLALTFSAPAGQQQRISAGEGEPEGDIRQVHDPSIIRERDTYYLFSTRAGIAIRCSNDLIHWRLCGDVFAHLPEWAVKDVPGLGGLWAPDVEYFNGKYHLYYSVSTFGSNRSSIGLATNETLDPASEKYRWVDQGKVISSNSGDDWNAIDPDVVLDEHDQPWLSFGSFWSGIKLRKLDRTTGKLSADDQNLYSLASRPRTAGAPGAIEAPNIIRKGDYYYLFVSFDLCCRGKDSTYNIRVGRSRSLTGPYVDRSGKPMMDGGGTLVVAGAGRWAGPGHSAVLQEQRGDRLVYHAYDTEWNGVATLRIGSIQWDAEGWPTIASSIQDLRSAPAVVMLDGRSVSLNAYVWRDFMPGQWGVEGSPLMATFKITTADKQALPTGIRIDRAWFVFGDQSWEATYFRDQRPGQEREKDGWINCPTSPECEATARGGPRLGPGVVVDVVVRFTDREGKQYFLQAPHQRVMRID